jgi:hypothetical protein
MPVVAGVAAAEAEDGGKSKVVALRDRKSERLFGEKVIQ